MALAVLELPPIAHHWLETDDDTPRVPEPWPSSPMDSAQSRRAWKEEKRV